MWYRLSNKKRVSLVIVFNNDKVLIGEKQHGFEIPGGHSNLLEDDKDAAKRELEEETNLKVKKLKLFRTMHMPDKIVNVYYTDKFEGDIKPGSDILDAHWHTLDNIPKMKFNGHELIVDAYKEFKKKS